MKMAEFVEGWDVVETLGEGAFGEVKLLLNKQTGEAVAMKVMDLQRHPEAARSIKKEISVHRQLNHRNILKFYGHRIDECRHYLFLEYAAGGELFDRIEPDLGMAEAEAQKFFRQLISGMDYLHSHGMTHRDIKPENILIDEHDELKISDFGMATLYRYKGKERQLDRRCGTLPYVAPEVLTRPYNAEPADVWSCGIVLVVMLAGALPWDKPTCDCSEYMGWRKGFLSFTPWRKMSNKALSLLKKVLLPAPNRRFTINQIKQHSWFTQILQESISRSSECYSPVKRLRSDLELSQCSRSPFTHSQPARAVLDSPSTKNYPLSFSQPAHPEDMLLSSQTQGSTQQSQSPMARLVKRMTRFFVNIDSEQLQKRLESVCSNLKYECKVVASNLMTISTVDRRKNTLVWKATILEMGGKVLLDFRLSKGDGLEFKRHFVKIREQLGDVILKVPVSWNVAYATNSVP